MSVKYNKSVGGLNKLCLCFILYNEEASIEQAIKAFHYEGTPIYDILMVGIDKKTNDNTYEIVNQFCPDENIIWFDFNDDFAGSRNIVLREVEKLKDIEWIFMPDGHEVLRHESVEAVKSMVDTVDEKIHLISPYVDLDVDENDIPNISFFRPMMLRNHKGIFFERKVHNYLDAPVENKAYAPEIRLIHNMEHKRREMRAKQRKDMNTKELSKNAETGDIRDMFFLGNTYSEQGLYEKAIVEYEKCLLEIHDTDRDMAAEVSIMCAQCYLALEKWLELKMKCLHAINNRWDRAEPYFFLGVASVSVGRNEYEKGSNERKLMLTQAVHWFNVSAGMEKPTTIYFLQGKHYTWYPYDALCDVLTELGRYEEALEAGKKVLEYKKNDKLALKNVEELERFINKGESEIKKEVVSINNADPFSI